MKFPRKARAGLLLFLTAGPFLVFLFLHLFGKNHFELDRYPLGYGDLFKEEAAAAEELLVLDTSVNQSSAAAVASQLRRLDAFWEDAGDQPDLIWLDGQNSSMLNQLGRSWFLDELSVSLTSVKGKTTKKLPAPPRAFLFDKEKTLRGVYGLWSNKSVDTLMLEYRILISD